MSKISKYLTRQAILTAKDIKTESIHVPEWMDEEGNDLVLVKGLNGKERDAYEASQVQIEGGQVKFNKENIRAKLIALTVVNEELNSIFSIGDVEALGQKSGAALARVFEVAQKLSGLTQESLEKTEKNSTTTTSDISSTN